MWRQAELLPSLETAGATAHAATNGRSGVEAAETGESDALERGEGVLCERWDSRRGSVRQLILYRAQRGRVNAR
jgi:hypothetical protein